jgi:hypothetical protein
MVASPSSYNRVTCYTSYGVAKTWRLLKLSLTMARSEVLRCLLVQFCPHQTAQGALERSHVHTERGNISGYSLHYYYAGG